MKQSRAFTLLELLISTTLFVATVVAVIGMVTAVVTSTATSLSLRDLNGTLRNVNNKITDIVYEAGCIKSEGVDVVVLYDNQCARKEAKIIFKNDDIVISDLSSETKLNPDNTKATAVKNKSVFDVKSDNLLEINFELKVETDKADSKVQYFTSAITGS